MFPLLDKPPSGKKIIYTKKDNF